MQSADVSWASSIGFLVPLAVGDVHVWRVWLDRPADEVALWGRTISAEEFVRAQRFRIESARRQFIVARAALRNILAKYLGTQAIDVRFTHSAMGKPRLADDGPPFHFNVSHSHDVALIAITSHEEVGVDVERVRSFPNQLPLAERFFHASEVQQLGCLPEAQLAEAFFHAWTRKEAFVKATGSGLGFGVDRIEVTLLPGEPAKLIRLDGCERAASAWSFVHLEPGPGYVGALAIRGEPLRVRAIHWASD